jgi:hypothetical protein
MLRQKRDDSINPSIRKNRHLCQHLRVRSALRKASCGFYAAILRVPVDFWAGVAPRPNQGRVDATPPP